MLRRGVHLEGSFDERVSLLMGRMLAHMGVELEWPTHLEAGDRARCNYTVRTSPVIGKEYSRAK